MKKVFVFGQAKKLHSLQIVFRAIKNFGRIFIKVEQQGNQLLQQSNDVPKANQVLILTSYTYRVKRSRNYNKKKMKKRKSEEASDEPK